MVMVDAVVGAAAGQLLGAFRLLSLMGGALVAVARAARESKRTEGITTKVKREREQPVRTRRPAAR